MWSERVTPDHNLLLPFIRQLAGPLDYEGGSMQNAQLKDFRAIFERPLSQGTRVHQLAQYVIYVSPLQYLAGNPSDYLREPDFTSFLAGIPTTWDDTRVIAGELSDYVVLARRSGHTWYLAAMTDWTARTLNIPLSFLDNEKYHAIIYADGINADRYASDYILSNQYLTRIDTLNIQLAPGGGWVARISRTKY
jgi:alpha-glucosidase